jgi:hypothetical protein
LRELYLSRNGGRPTKNPQNYYLSLSYDKEEDEEKIQDKKEPSEPSTPTTQRCHDDTTLNGKGNGDCP